MKISALLALLCLLQTFSLLYLSGVLGRATTSRNCHLLKVLLLFLNTVFGVWMMQLRDLRTYFKVEIFQELVKLYVSLKFGEKLLDQVNDQYVRNKLKVVLFPFLHRGHWTRITEPVGGRLSYKPHVYDINAPELYIPLTVFGTYVILAGFSFGLLRKFRPEAPSLQFTRGLACWFLQFMLLKGILFSLGGGEATLLDLMAYGGYAFMGMSLEILARLLSSYSYYFLIPWMCICMGIFLVKTVKRVLFTEMRSHERHSSKQHYLLLFMAIAQFPWFFWLGNTGA